MRRFQSIAALLMLFVMMPLPRACAARLSSGNVQQKCCKPHIADTCCEGSKKLCSATQAPADATLYPGQSGLPLLLPAATVAVLHADRIDGLKLSRVMLARPEQHSPPGLIIAATIVLRV
jgi:hypothetical protein